MGGTAILIRGDLDEERQEPPRGFFSRLLGKPDPKRGLPEGFVDLPCRDLAILKDDFADFLASRWSAPSPSSKLILEYLDTAGISTYLRGDRDPEGRRTWYVQLSFRGCAGMAEVSAEVAAHWAMLWYESERARVDLELLRPRGFSASSVELIADETAFLPIGSGGYASYQVAPDFPEERRFFSMDAAAAESDEVQADLIHTWLEANGAALIRERGCLCQICAPEFDSEQIPGFVQHA